MKRKRHTEEQIAYALKQAEAGVAFWTECILQGWFAFSANCMANHGSAFCPAVWQGFTSETGFLGLLEISGGSFGMVYASYGHGGEYECELDSQEKTLTEDFYFVGMRAGDGLLFDAAKSRGPYLGFIQFLLR